MEDEVEEYKYKPCPITGLKCGGMIEDECPFEVCPYEKIEGVVNEVVEEIAEYERNKSGRTD